MRRIKPIKKETEEQRFARIKNEEHEKLERKKKDIERIESKDKAKLTHHWKNNIEFDQLRGTGRPYPQYCKKCGLSYLVFKIDPKICPKI